MKKFVILCLSLLLAGCAVTTTNLYVDRTLEETNIKDIKVFKQMPTGRLYEKIGEITVDQASDWVDVERNLKKEASKIGADAVYIMDSNTRTQSYVTGNQYGVSGGSSESLLVTGVAVKYTD